MKEGIIKRNPEHIQRGLALIFVIIVIVKLVESLIKGYYFYSLFAYSFIGFAIYFTAKIERVEYNIFEAMFWLPLSIKRIILGSLPYREA